MNPPGANENRLLERWRPLLFSLHFLNLRDEFTDKESVGGTYELSDSGTNIQAVTLMARKCCKGDSCVVRKELATLLEPDESITDRILEAACALAHKRRRLSLKEQRGCVTELFELPAGCSLADEFAIAYQTERDYISGWLEIHHYPKNASGAVCC